MGGGKFCTIIGCSACSTRCRGLSFHRIPQKEKHASWKKAMIAIINRSDNSFNPDKAFICSRHFKEDCFIISPGGIKMLKPGSLPTEFMPEQSIVTSVPNLGRQLKQLSLDQNGTFMSDFDPERSKREMRKLNRKIHKENKKLNQMYDETGRLLENSLDVCDCLDVDCPGCHFPCPRCASEKCGAECRCGRRWTYEQIEVEGTNLAFKWSATQSL